MDKVKSFLYRHGRRISARSSEANVCVAKVAIMSLESGIAKFDDEIYWPFGTNVDFRGQFGKVMLIDNAYEINVEHIWANC